MLISAEIKYNLPGIPQEADVVVLAYMSGTPIRYGRFVRLGDWDVR
jgi:hypothetical protein